MSINDDLPFELRQIAEGLDMEAEDNGVTPPCSEAIVLRDTADEIERLRKANTAQYEGMLRQHERATKAEVALLEARALIRWCYHDGENMPEQWRSIIEAARVAPVDILHTCSRCASSHGLFGDLRCTNPDSGRDVVGYTDTCPLWRESCFV